jgi:DNA-binding MarR family transcriptional regulator
MTEKGNSEIDEKPRESIGKWISILQRYGKIFIDRELEPYKIGYGQFPFLIALYREDGISQEALSKFLNVDKATTTRAVKKLLKEGYISRVTDSADKRAYKIYLTKKGKEMSSVIKKISARWTNVLLNDFSKREKEIILTLLKKMAKNASEFQ